MRNRISTIAPKKYKNTRKQDENKATESEYHEGNRPRLPNPEPSHFISVPGPSPDSASARPKIHFVEERSILCRGMSENNTPEAKPPVEEKKPVTPKKVRKQWKNPALRAMGIPRFSLPSRNWMIFWSLLASIGGGIAYDKHEQKKIREKYMKQVEKLGEEIYATDRLPRKLTIFIAPPPNDFLEESLRHFRKHIKPILNAAAIDYDIYTENRQGDIRAQVAEKIRQLRRETAELEKKRQDDARVQAYNRSWTKFFKDVPATLKSLVSKKEEPEVLVARLDLYAPLDVLGLYKVVDTVQPKRDDETAGVICIGRGTYKEYMSGVHEGLLGPLEKPVEPLEPPKVVELGESTEEGQVAETEPAKADEISDFGEKEDEKGEQDPVPKPFILASQYADAPVAPEIDFGSVIRNKQNVPVLFEQPVYVFPVPKLSGMFNIPRKIYRYFTRRELAEDVSSKTLAVVYGSSRPFEFKDSFLGLEEELDWPKKWVERGKAKESEWVQEVTVDERITKRMRVFEEHVNTKTAN